MRIALKLKWTKYCALAAAGADNTNDNLNNIIFTIKGTKLYVPAVTLSIKDNQQISKRLSKGSEWSVYWHVYKTKSARKNSTNEHKSFLESNFVRVNRLFGLIYLNKDDNAKRFKARRYYLPKGVIKDYVVIIIGKYFYEQPINSDIKWFEEIRKLTTGQGDNCATWYLLDYEYIKIHYGLITVDLGKQKELDANPQETQQIELVGQLKIDDGENADGTQTTFVLKCLEKIKETRLKFSQGSATAL